jgi:hypothetical protein
LNSRTYKKSCRQVRREKLDKEREQREKYISRKYSPTYIAKREGKKRRKETDILNKLTS